MAQSIAQILETMSLLDGWEDKYAYVIDLGRQLPEYPENYRDEDHLVPGCTSRVWLHWAFDDAGRLKLCLDSDAHIVKGLIAILQSAYEDKTPHEIAAFDINALFDELKLEEHLSPNRRNGFFSVAQKIRALGQG